MVPTLFFYQLGRVALVWVFLMLYWLWPPGSAARRQPIATPKPPQRQRSKAPTAFPGLTHKPHCALCERETAPPSPPSPVPPDPMPLTNRRPRSVDTSRHFCPHTDCDSRGWLGLHNLRANGHPSGGPWRQLQCLGCLGYFPEHHGTIVHGQHAAVERIVRVLACLAEGLGMRATARVFEVDANTVLQWLVQAAEHLRAFSRYVLCEVHVQQVQLDAFYAGLRDLKAGAISDDEALKRLERSSYWVWTAMDPERTLLVVIEVGTRTLEMAQRVVHQVAQVLAPGCLPLFLTDGLKDYGTAWLAHFGYWLHPERRRAQGPRPKPRWMPRPELLYAQVVQSYWRRRLVSVTHRVVFGTMERVRQVLSVGGRKMHPAFVARLNRDIRQRVAAVGRRVTTLCQGEDGVRQQLAVYHAYDNFCLPHASLRQPLRIAETTHGRGSAKVWRPCTPAMAAGLTDHVWSLREVLLFRVPPWPQPQSV
jgi:hypothetical protein